MAKVVAVRVETLCAEYDVWCETCNLSTAAIFWFTITTGGHTTLHSRVVCAGHSAEAPSPASDEPPCAS